MELNTLSDSEQTFRFVNDELQSSLIRLLVEAGIAHHQANDRTIHYSPEQRLEPFIDQIVDVYFGCRENYTTEIANYLFAWGGCNWYRVDIEDGTKAERYRRFKKFTGTPLIEENRSGMTFFVQPTYQKLYRHQGVPTHASFVLRDKELDPVVVTAALGITPTFACSRGEPFVRPTHRPLKDHPAYPSQWGWWELCSEPHISSNDIVPHLEWLLGVLEPVSQELEVETARLGSEDGVDCCFIQVLVVDVSYLRFVAEISGSLLRRIGALVQRISIYREHDDYF